MNDHEGRREEVRPGTAGKDFWRRRDRGRLRKERKASVHRERAMRLFYRKGPSLWAL